MTMHDDVDHDVMPPWTFVPLHALTPPVNRATWNRHTLSLPRGFSDEKNPKFLGLPNSTLTC